MYVRMYYMIANHRNTQQEISYFHVSALSDNLRYDAEI
jgi:hypothetical protein